MVSAIAIVACAVFLFRSEKQVSTLTTHRRAFDLHAREAADALSDLRIGQQAYVSIGQGVAFWAPKVQQTQDALTKTLASLRESATSTGAQSALDEVAATLTQFAEVDKRTRDYLRGGQQLMAGDVVFTEGVETAATAMRQLETARQAEAQGLDAAEAGVHKLEADALGATAGLAALALLLLAFRSAAQANASASSSILQPVSDFPAAPADTADSLLLRAESGAPPRSRPASPVLKTAARLCTDFARVQDLAGLKSLISQAAEVMDAGGLVVWMGNAEGADLRPVLSHGYSDQMLARMPSVPRSADNAAAAAYRTGTIQIVAAKPGGASGAPGAIVAPIIAPEGCVGALSAEIRGGGEGSESVGALATIFAAQLAGVLTPTTSESATAEQKTAAQI